MIARGKLGSGEYCVDLWFDPERGVMMYVETRDSQGNVIEARVWPLVEVVRELGLAYEEQGDIIL
jgi:mannose/cellobiose epimerase-like protein (N-acyl-D-glucosamine 2-epimerase family)